MPVGTRPISAAPLFKATALSYGIPWAGTRGFRHPLAVAPFIVASLICSLHAANRK